MPRTPANRRPAPPSKGTAIGTDRNAVRRAAYDQVPGVADDLRARARQRYQETSGARTSVTERLTARGTLREVTYTDAERTYQVPTFTLGELADAIGKSEMTVRRWIQDDKLPEPYLRDVSRQNVRVYSIGEVRIIHDVLSRRDGFAYLTSTDNHAITELNERLHHYRAESI